MRKSAEGEHPPMLFKCEDCDHVLGGLCARCERAAAQRRTLKDPMASKEMLRWIEGDLHAPR